MSSADRTQEHLGDRDPWPEEDSGYMSNRRKTNKQVHGGRAGPGKTRLTTIEKAL
jgi:hypothetical protein